MMVKGFDGEPFTQEELDEILYGVRILSLENPIISSLLARVVDVTTPTYQLRRCVEELSMFMAYEIAKTFPMEEIRVRTPMGEVAIYHRIPEEELPVLFDILGASIYSTVGFERVFKGAPHAIISARRRGKGLEELEVELRYERIPKIDGKPVIFIDPAIATAYTLTGIYRLLENNEEKYGKIGKVIICGFVAAPFGIKRIKDVIPEAEIYVGSVSTLLNKKCYIHGPGYKGVGGGGIGDAGDRFLNVIPVD